MSANALDSPPGGYWGTFQRLFWTAVVGLSAFTASYVVLTLVYTKWLTVEKASLVYGSSVVASNLALLAHVVLALPSIVTGPFLFMEKLRDGTRAWIHRWLGYFYVVPVLLSAVVGFVLAVSNPLGLMAKGGFGLLAVFWFVSTAIALRYALKRDWLRHRRWVIRSYSLSLAVVTVRFLPPPFGMSMAEWYPYMTWICWMPNLALGETYVRFTTHKGALALPAFLRGTPPAR